MDKLTSVVMYVLWIVTIISVLTATFTDFKYEDLDALAVVFFVFAVVNSFFVIKR